MDTPIEETLLALQYEDLIRRISALFDEMILLRESLPSEVVAEIEGKHGITSGVDLAEGSGQ
jgi:hypothetical protein